MAGKYRLSTLGCKVNQYESQRIREVLDSLGLEQAGQNQTPHFAVVNTCAVTANAARKSRQAIRRLTRDGTQVFVIGCGASPGAGKPVQIDGVIASLGHDVDIAAELRRLITTYLRLEQTPSRTSDRTPSVCGDNRQRPGANGYDVYITPPDSSGSDGVGAQRTAVSSTGKILTDYSPLVKTGSPLSERIRRFAGHRRAFLKIQDGCDARCSYCLIPSLRPQLRWKPRATVVAEAEDLVRAGHREIVITGIYLGAYGRDTAVRRRFTADRSPLAELVAELAKVEGLRRLRLSSLEPGDVDTALLEALASNANCVPHLHLPLQSGSDRTLRRMNRQYTREAYLDMIGRVRSTLDRPAVTTDIIVGFPGETEADFEASVELAQHAQFAKIHAFPFSPREGTPAARWKDRFVEPAIVRERMKRLAEIELQCSLGFRQRAIGSVERVLVEGSESAGVDSGGFGGTSRYGRSDRYFVIHFKAAGEVRDGDLVSVRIDRVTPTRTFGTYLPPDAGRYPLSVLPATAQSRRPSTNDA